MVARHPLIPDQRFLVPPVRLLFVCFPSTHVFILCSRSSRPSLLQPQKDPAERASTTGAETSPSSLNLNTRFMINNDDDFFSNDFDWEDEAGEFEFEMDSDFELSSELEEAERQIRIQRMREELERIGTDWKTLTEEDLSPETEEAMLQRVLYIKTAPRTTFAKMLLTDGVELPAPDSLTSDADLHAALWNVIHGLAHRRVFIFYTNHLSDRDLYTKLWREHLNQKTIDMSWDEDASCYVDLLDGQNAEDARLWLKYYADEEERLWWRESMQDDGQSLPAAETPPYERDRILPKREHY